MRVGSVQINSAFSGHHYLPLSVGMLQAYALEHLNQPDRFEFLLPVDRRMPVAAAVEWLKDAEIAAFSLYVWNVRLSLAIAEALKRRNPGVLIVIGGPHVMNLPGMDEQFLRQHPFVDLAVHGEGELAFAELLGQAAGARDWGRVPSLSFLDADGAYRLTSRAPRINDLSLAPSPYLTDVFAPIMARYPEEQWLGMWETNRGCPFSCTFCDWGSAIASKVVRANIERLYREVDWFAEHEIRFIFCADANFGILPRDVDLARYIAKVKLERGYPKALSVQDTKNVKERAWEVRLALHAAGLNTGVVVSLQSIHPPTLEAIKRDNISLPDFFEIQRRFAAQGIETMTDLILGLPEETYDSFADGVSEIIANGQHNRIQFNNLSILPNAPMADPEYRQRYGLETVHSWIVNVRGVLEDSEVPEIQELVIATQAMPRPDWVRARRFGWMVGLLHCDKVLQIPLIVAHELGGASYRALIELFADGRFDPAAFPTLTVVQQFFTAKAHDIQSGGLEYCHAPQWLNAHWVADEYIYAQLVTEGKLDQFYAETERLLGERITIEPALLKDALRLNRALLKTPFVSTDLELECSWNVWEFYRGIVEGSPTPVSRDTFRYHIDRTTEQWWSWDQYFREVIWFGHKRGAYLYGNKISELELAGHE